MRGPGLKTAELSGRRGTQVTTLESDVTGVALDSMGQGVLLTDIRGDVVYLNRMAEQMTGWSRDEARGRPVTDILRIVDRMSGKPAANSVEIVTNEDETTKVTAACKNCVLVRRDGLECGIENTVTSTHDHDGTPTGTIIVFHDVSKARAKSAEMSHLAQHDFLTDLPNRMLFNDRLQQAISLADRQGTQLAIMFVDLDGFKKINDSLGHGLGDKLLHSVAVRLVGCVRRADTVCRLGGDEFVILLSQVELEEDAAVSARKILRSLSAPHNIDNKKVDVTVSIGVSTYPGDGRDAESLMHKADTAMYEAKQKGPNNYQFFRQEMQIRAAELQLLEGDLRCALGRNEFVLEYQPKFNIQTGHMTGVEALLRWKHPKRGMVGPMEFVPLTEERGLIVPIGRWVLLEACKQAQIWRGSGRGPVSMAVNVSAREFESADFVSEVRAALIATGVEPHNLELELTERVLMRDVESTLITLGKLKDMGVQLAIDDFGTGYSSFTYLRRFRVDTLKLHQSFIHGIAEDEVDATIVGAMINIGRSLGQRVIAEGVETRAQLTFLKRHGCDGGQGYYFSPPVSADQLGKLLETGICAAVLN